MRILTVEFCDDCPICCEDMSGNRHCRELGKNIPVDQNADYNILENCPLDDNTELERLLNKVNKVTAYHRGGRPVQERDLTALSNAQVEYEQREKK